uniref:Uncharacterized protein n=1 Tax=Ganoderma boninense TaxID=34458 RepID=A0A5K1JY91_9APHY|nr:Uncharacterized protein [Ganoderma boninense]
MDDILGSLLSCFQAHYKVMKDDFAKTRSRPHLRAQDRLFDDDDDDGHVSDDSSDDDDDDDTPTPEERDLARQILDHTFALDLVATTVQSSDWPEDDLFQYVEDASLEQQAAPYSWAGAHRFAPRSSSSSVDAPDSRPAADHAA